MYTTNPDEEIIGIDLGTSNSCVAIKRNKKIEIIADTKSGNRIIGSIVCFKNNKERLIGESAKNYILQYPESTIYDSKRLIGLKFNNPSVQNDIKNWPIKIIEDKKTGKPKYVIKVENEEKEYFPENIASMILGYLKTFSETYENKKIKKVVIGVPANFNSLQRKATYEAAVEAGFEDINLINEPTAAAIAYGNTIKSDEERKILIFDLGGGTFDVTVLKNIGNEYYILASMGEEHLGGEDFTQRLIDYIISEIKKIEEFKNIDFKDKKNEKIIKLHRKLRKLTEQLKISLTAEITSSFFYDMLYGIKNFSLDITRSKYEELCMDLWKKCFKKVDEALKISKLKKDEIDEIILVGGSSRTPKIKQMVQDYFNGKEPLQNINPDEVVAKGALQSIYSKIYIHDILSKSIGIEINNGKMDIIIPAGTILPQKNSKLLLFNKLYEVKGKLRIITIKIYEGNSENVSNNELLGSFSVKLGNDNNEKTITIKMLINYNSMLKVSVFHNNDLKNEYSTELNLF